MTRFLTIFTVAFIVCFESPAIISGSEYNGPMNVTGINGDNYGTQDNRQGGSMINGPIIINGNGDGVINLGDGNTGEVNRVERIIGCDKSCDVFNDAYSFYQKGGPENERQALMRFEDIIEKGGKAYPYALKLKNNLLRRH